VLLLRRLFPPPAAGDAFHAVQNLFSEIISEASNRPS
jgi:hypothetical protein